MGGDGAYQLDYTWQPFSIFAKNEKFVLFRFFAKNRGTKKRKINFSIKPLLFGTFSLKNTHFDQIFDDEPFW